MTDYKLDDFIYKNNILQPLKGFCNTIREGSINKAAEKMGLTQSSVTRQIKALERDLGILLFERVGNRVIPTEEGKKLYEMGIIHLQGIESLFANFHQALKEKSDNTLTIAVHQAVGSYILPKYIKHLIDQPEFKDLNIKICNIPRKEAFDRLKNKEVDFAFYSSISEESIPTEIHKDNVFKYKNALIMHKNHPLSKKKHITKDDLKEYPYLLRDSFSFYDIRRALNLKVSNITFENCTTDITIGLVSENVEITGVPEILLKNNSITPNENIVYKNTDHLLPESAYALFYLKNYKQKKCVECIINDVLKDKEECYKN